MSKHTPGPWKLVTLNYPQPPREVIIGVGVGDEIVDGYSTVLFNTVLPDTDDEYIDEHEQIKANARLIAAAPELLEVLEFCISEFETEIYAGEFIKKVIPKIKEAIKKATL